MARMSYMGHCSIGGALIKCTSMSVTKKVEPLFFDHVFGLRDTGSGGLKGPGGAGGRENRQKGIYRWSRSTGSASISGPFTEGVFHTLIELAITGGQTIADFTFYSGVGKSLVEPFITSLNVDVKAGDVASFSAELIGKDVVQGGGGIVTSEPEKLITWDKCGVACGGLDANEIVGFTLGITNPAIPIQVSGSSTTDLGPKDIRIGMQEVKGSVSIFSSNSWSLGTGNQDITFSVGSAEYTIRVVYSGPTENSASGPFVCTVPFTGAAEGPVWS